MPPSDITVRSYVIEPENTFLHISLNSPTNSEFESSKQKGLAPLVLRATIMERFRKVSTIG
jgi:hypothetical protein